MRSIIFKTAANYLMPILLLFSFFLLLRGHNLPGGGFTGGLTAAAAYTMYLIAHGVEETKSILGIEPLNYIIIGLSVAIISGILPLFVGKSFLTGLWATFEVPIAGKLGTPLFFDIGVYFVVIGVVLKIIFTLAEEEVQE